MMVIMLDANIRLTDILQILQSRKLDRVLEGGVFVVEGATGSVATLIVEEKKDV